MAPRVQLRAELAGAASGITGHLAAAAATAVNLQYHLYSVVFVFCWATVSCIMWAEKTFELLFPDCFHRSQSNLLWKHLQKREKHFFNI